MAQLELASLLVAAPVSGTAGTTGGNSPPSEVSPEMAGTTQSFSQLLAGTAQPSAPPLAPGQIAGELAAGPTLNNLPLPTPAPAANDPAHLAPVDPAQALATLVEGLVPTVDGDAGTSDGKPSKLDSETLDTPSDAHTAEAAWLGWPLFLESRAALRGDGGTFGAAHPDSPSTEVALTERAFAGIGTSSTQFASWPPCAEDSTELAISSKSLLPSSIQQPLITGDQTHRASTQTLEPRLAGSAGVDSLVSASPTKAILAGLTPTLLSNQTGPSASAMLQPANLAVALSEILPPVLTEPTPRPIIPDSNVPTGLPAAAIAKAASTTVLSEAASSGSSSSTPGSTDLAALLKATVSAQPSGSGMTVSVTTTSITAATETVLTQPADPVASPFLASATGNEQIDWQRRLAQSFVRTRQSDPAVEGSSPSGDSLKSLSALAAKTASQAIDSETGTAGAAARLTIPFHGSQTEAKSAAGAGLQRRPLLAIPIVAAHNQPLTEESTTAITRPEMDDKAPWEDAAATTKRFQAAGSSPAIANPEPVASGSLETRWNASTPVTSSIATPERIADNGTTTRTVESTPTVVAPAARIDSSSATPYRPAASNPSMPLPTAPEVLDMQQKNWERTLARQLDWAVNNRLQEAEIKVNPPDLGPLEMRLTLHHNQTSVMFFSHEAAVREALETALPRLRELLDGQGITLNQAQVSDQSLARHQAGAGEQSGYGQRERNRMPSPADTEAPVETVQPRNRSRNLRGAVDDYA